MHDKQAWSQYQRAIDRAWRTQQDPTDLLTAMRTAAVACGFQQQPHTEDDQPPNALGDMLHDLWHAKQQLPALLHTYTPETRHHIHNCRTEIAHISADLQQWQIHRQQRIAQEPEQYAQHELPYKAIWHLNNPMTNTGHCTITTVRQPDGSLTNDPATVLGATQDSLLQKHSPTQDTLDTDTQNKIETLPQDFNYTRRRQLEKHPFTIHNVWKAIHNLRQHKTSGYDGLPAEAYHLSAHLLRILSHRLWDIFTGQTPLPSDWANVVRPLYKRRDWANPDNWRPIVCAVTEFKIVWTILMRRIRHHLDPHIAASLWGAIPGRSPHEPIFLQDTVADMDAVDFSIASLHLKGAFPNIPWLHSEAVWKSLGLPFYNFTSKYIRTRKYTFRTGAGLNPFLEPGSGIPQGGAEGPFLYLLVTLPLALTIELHYPAYPPYLLLSPLVGFTNDTNLTVAHTPHEPHTPDDGPTVRQHANNLLDVTVSYLSHNNLIIHPTKSVVMIKGSATAPALRPQGPPMHVVEATGHLGVIQTTNPDNTTLPPRLQSHLAHICIPGYQNPLPVTPKLGVLPPEGFHRLSSIPPDTPPHRPPTSHARLHQGMGSTWGLARLHTHSGHPCGMAPLRGRHKGRGKGSLHQAHRTPSPPHDPQLLPGSPRSRHDPPPDRAKSSQHTPTLMIHQTGMPTNTNTRI